MQHGIPLISYFSTDDDEEGDAVEEVVPPPTQVIGKIVELSPSSPPQGLQLSHFIKVLRLDFYRLDYWNQMYHFRSVAPL